MVNEEYLALIELVKEELLRVGLGDIADDTHYEIVQDGSDSARQLPEPQEHLLLLLDAFERHMAAHDAATARVALDRLNAACSDASETIEDVQIRPIGRIGAAEDDLQAVSLLSGPDYGPARKELRELKDAISNAERDEGGAR